VVEVHKSEHEHAPTQHRNTEEMIASDWDHQLKDDHARHKLVHDTLSSVHGVSAHEAALVVHKVDQEDVMPQEFLAKLTALIWDPIPKQENVRHSHALLMETGENGPHGRDAANLVVEERRSSHVCATTPHQHLVESDVRDVKWLLTPATSNHALLMVNGQHLVHGYPAANHAEEVYKGRYENAQTQLPNMKANIVLGQLLSLNNVTPIIVPSMEVGPNGECGENAARLVEEDAPTECDDAQTHPQNTVEIDALEHPSKQNNVEPSSVQSMETGMPLVHMSLAANLVVVEFRSVEDIVTTQFLSTTAKAAVDQPHEAKPATLNPVQLMVPTPNGQHSLLVHSRAAVECKLDIVNVHHQNMEVNHAVY